MLSRSIRASHNVVARYARQQCVATARRSLFTPSAIRSADLVQDMYLRELKNYKVQPTKPSDSEGQVQNFSIPKPPQSPEESDIASDLQAYESQAVEIEGQATEGNAAAVVEDWFEEETEEAAGSASSSH